MFYRPDGEKLRMISNRKLGPGRLSFTAYESIKVLLKKVYLVLLILDLTVFICSYLYIRQKIYLT